MIEMKMENEQVLEMGEDWIAAITEGAFNRLEGFCQPEVTSTLLLPKRVMTLDNAVDLAAKYREWFGSCTDFRVEGSRVNRVGRRLGIFYRFRLWDDEAWYTIEQQVYCTLKDGRVERLHLLCSGFQLVAATDVAATSDGGQALIGDALLEFHSEDPDAASACAVLTPMIRSKLGEMQSGQVLEVRVDDPTARGDIESWSRLSGNTLLKVIDDAGPEQRFFLKKK